MTTVQIDQPAISEATAAMKEYLLEERGGLCVGGRADSNQRKLEKYMNALFMSYYNLNFEEEECDFMERQISGVMATVGQLRQDVAVLRTMLAQVQQRLDGFEKRQREDEGEERERKRDKKTPKWSGYVQPPP
eukprot:PhM_4_TR13890/c3_g1_i3/m.5539